MITHEDSLLNFEKQIAYALETFKPDGIEGRDVQNIVLCGLGGSGIGGRIARGFYLKNATCPVEVFSDYFLPNYISNKTLVILSSYSGNTEETLDMFDEAQKAGAQIIGVCSGGELLAKLKAGNYPFFTVPTGYQPRMALGFSFSFNLLILGTIFNYNAKAELETAKSLYLNSDLYQQVATTVFESWNSNPKQPVLIFCDEHYAGVAVRFCQQVQENAKGQAYSLILPEANHNATEFIYGNVNSNILFLNSGLNERTNLRFEFLRKLLSDNGNSVSDLSLKGASLTEILKAIYILDWVSIKLSNAKGVDNMKVLNIDKLKNYLKDA